MPGYINVAGLMWQRRSIACERVRRLGLEVDWRQLGQPKNAEELAGFFEGDSAFVPCDAGYEAWLYRDPCSYWEDDEPDGRVVRLRPAAPRVEVTTPPASASKAATGARAGTGARAAAPATTQRAKR